MPQKITFITRPKDRFEVPASEGYQLYSAILNIMRESDDEISKHAHDSPISSISIGMLQGRFGRSARPHHKTIDPTNTYRFNLGVTDPKEVEIFQSIIQPLILRERDIRLDGGLLQVEEVTSSAATFEELVNSAAGLEGSRIRFRFRSPTCIQYKNTRVFEMFPHRAAVFSSLVSKWNAVCPEGLKMDISRDEIARYVMEKPLSYDTHSVMVNTVFDKAKGHHRPIFKQGFTGACIYLFAKDAPRDVRNGVQVLSRFAEYSGVGSSVSRGCGGVEVGMEEEKR